MGSMFCCCSKDLKDEASDQTDGKRGKKLDYDPDFKGPIRGKARRPKDLLCLILFITFVVLMMAIGIYSWANGVPERLIYPTDSRGRLCGADPAVANKPFLVFFDLTKCASVASVASLVTGQLDTSEIFTCPTPQVCVSECPTANEFGVRSNPVCVDEVDTSRFTNISVDLSSVSSISETSSNVAALLEHITLEQCAPYYLVSTAVARRCIPTFVDITSQAESVFNFTSPSELESLANMDNSSLSFTDLVFSVNIESLVSGSFSQQLLVAARQFLLDVYQDFAVVWPGLLLGLLGALILSFLYVFLLRWLAGPMVFLGIFLAVLLSAGVAGFSYYQFYCLQNTASIANTVLNLNISLVDFVANSTDIISISNQICTSTAVVRDFIDSQLPWFEYQEYTWLAIGILGTLVLLAIVLILIFLGKQICVSIAIIKEASRAVIGVPTSLVYPILTWTLIVLIFLYWGIVAIFLLTASQPSYAIIMNGSLSESDRNLSYVDSTLGVVINGTVCNLPPFEPFNYTIFVLDAATNMNISIACQFDQFVTTNFLLGLQIYHLFGLFWLVNFVLALGEVTLAGGFASWYWSFNKKDVPRFALLQSLGRALLFHTGSIAFGALLIALVQMARVILAYVQKKLKGKTGRVAKALLCMLQCCLWCFEKILRYINRQAYIEIAIYGYDFCTGACKAVKLLLRNILTTAVKDRIVTFLLFLGKIAITALVGVGAYLGFGGFTDLGTSLWGRALNYYLLPVMLLVFAAYTISSGFMTVYHMAVDTVFICALEDLERNNGSDKPYYMSKHMLKLLKPFNEVEDLERNNGIDKPYFMSKELMKLLNAHNVKPNKDETDSQANILEMEEVNK